MNKLKALLALITKADNTKLLTRPQLHSSPLKELKQDQVAYIEQQLGLNQGQLNGCMRSSCESLNLIVNSL